MQNSNDNILGVDLPASPSCLKAEAEHGPIFSRAPNHINLFGLVISMITKPHQFLWFGDIHRPKPGKLMWLGEHKGLAFARLSPEMGATFLGMAAIWRPFTIRVPGGAAAPFAPLDPAGPSRHLVRVPGGRQPNGRAGVRESRVATPPGS